LLIPKPGHPLHRHDARRGCPRTREALKRVHLLVDGEVRRSVHWLLLNRPFRFPCSFRQGHSRCHQCPCQGRAFCGGLKKLQKRNRLRRDLCRRITLSGKGLVVRLSICAGIRLCVVVDDPAAPSCFSYSPKLLRQRYSSVEPWATMCPMRSRQSAGRQVSVAEVPTF